MAVTSLLRTLAIGAVASAVATYAKTQAEGVLQPLSEHAAPPMVVEKNELGADPADHPENMPPAQIVGQVAKVAGRPVSDQQRVQLSAPLHWGMGMGFGIAYALVARRFPLVRAGFGLGAGAALFAATHGSTLPAAGLQDPPWKLPTSWWGWEGGSHLAYGAVLDTGIRLLDEVLPAG